MGVAREQAGLLGVRVQQQRHESFFFSLFFFVCLFSTVVSNDGSVKLFSRACKELDFMAAMTIIRTYTHCTQ